jgi:hypothetical protein
LNCFERKNPIVNMTFWEDDKRGITNKFDNSPSSTLNDVANEFVIIGHLIEYFSAAFALHFTCKATQIKKRHEEIHVRGGLR